MRQDVRGQRHNGKIWVDNPADGRLTALFSHDVNRFGDLNIAPTAPFNISEESSGIIEVSELFRTSKFDLDR